MQPVRELLQKKNKLKVKGWKRYSISKWNEKKVGEAIFISD